MPRINGQPGPDSERLTSSLPAELAHLSKEALIQRIKLLESRLSLPSPSQTPKPSPYPFEGRPRRKIALLISYSGWAHCGLAYQTTPTPLTTVEEELFAALETGRLVADASRPDEFGFSRCGRTDRGVSAAGQVVSLWIRSNLGSDELPEVDLGAGKSRRRAASEDDEGGDSEDEGIVGGAVQVDETKADQKPLPSRETDSRELPYLSILNRLLPSTIRVLAWSPVSSAFDARFSCRYRHYKYFFHPSPTGLDIALMKRAARKLEGEHDFRNLCKVDASKQISNFKRRVLSAEINPWEYDEEGGRSGSLLGGGNNEKEWPGMWVFDLKGTAFLYHQVRHIMAVLFLVGSKLEPPEIVDHLINVDPPSSPSPSSASSTRPFPEYDAVNSRPSYEMADDLPLVLFECGYDEGSLDWRSSLHAATSFTSSAPSSSREKGPLMDPNPLGPGWPPLPLLDSLQRQATSIFTELTRWRIKMAMETLSLGKLRGLVATPSPTESRTADSTTPSMESQKKQARALPPHQLGGGRINPSGKYTPLLRRPRNDSPEIVNERWRLGRGMRRADRKGANLASAEVKVEDAGPM